MLLQSNTDRSIRLLGGFDPLKFLHDAPTREGPLLLTTTVRDDDRSVGLVVGVWRVSVLCLSVRV